MPRRLVGPLRIRASNPCWFARYQYPRERWEEAKLKGLPMRRARSLKTTEHSTALVRWGPVYEELKQEALAALDGRLLTEERLAAHLDYPEGIFTAAEELSRQRFRGEGQEQHPLWEEAFEALKTRRLPTSWDDLIRKRQERALASSGRPLSKAWASTAHQAASEAAARGCKRPAQIDKGMVRRLQAELPGSPQNRSKLMSVLSGLIQTGLEEDLLDLPSNPFKLVRWSAVTKPEDRYRPLSDHELQKLLACDDPLLTILAMTGLRSGELLSRRPEHLEGSMLQVCAVGDWRPKTLSSTRRIAIPAALVPVLADAMPFKASIQQNQSRLLRKVKALFPGAVVHGLRHTYVTLARRAGMPLEVMQELLGHSKTERITGGYGAFPDGLLQEWAEKVYRVVVGREGTCET